MHHICYEVGDLRAARATTVAGRRAPARRRRAKLGAHGNPVLFLHPKDFAGTLIELEEVQPQ
jgi:methylmalonyl-CoA/ethylmalonyl-CoA epimerase